MTTTTAQPEIHHGSEMMARYTGSGLDWTIYRLDANDDWQVVKTTTVTADQHTAMIAQYERDMARPSIHMGR